MSREPTFKVAPINGFVCNSPTDKSAGHVTICSPSAAMAPPSVMARLSRPPSPAISSANSRPIFHQHRSLRLALCRPLRSHPHPQFRSRLLRRRFRQHPRKPCQHLRLRHLYQVYQFHLRRLSFHHPPSYHRPALRLPLLYQQHPPRQQFHRHLHKPCQRLQQLSQRQLYQQLRSRL